MIIDSHVHLSTFGHEEQSFSHIRDSLLSSMHRLGISYSFICPDSEPNTGVSDLDTTRALVGDHTELLMLGTACIPELDPAACYVLVHFEHGQGADLVAERGKALCARVGSMTDAELFWTSASGPGTFQDGEQTILNPQLKPGSLKKIASAGNAPALAKGELDRCVATS